MNWRMFLLGAVVACLLLLFLMLYGSDPVFDELFVIAPCIAILIFISLLLLAIPRTRRVSAKLLLATGAFVATCVIGLRFEATLRPTLRWAFFSRKFKAQVLVEPEQPSGLLKHVEWDGWGGAPVGDWTTYVVFDPGDSLQTVAGRAHPGAVQGIPCEVLRVQKLESRWYSVTLEMNEWWDQCRNKSFPRSRVTADSSL